MKYNITSNEGDRTSVSAFPRDGSILVATAEHPRFNDICEALQKTPQAPDDDIKALFDVSVPLAKRFDRLSERVMVNAGRVFFDGDEVHDALSQTVVRFFLEGNDDFMPLVNFMEKIATNPNEHSRQNLFRWLQKHKFMLAPDGDFIAYKGIRDDDLSSHAGNAFVNGEVINDKRIPNTPDTIIEMPRSDVQFNPSQGCSTGLHVGNFSYARGFAPKTIRVKVNPRDVVSVPTDSNDEKMRVCRYRVMGAVSAEDSKLFFDLRKEPTRRVAGKTSEPEPVKVAAGKRRNRPLRAEQAPRKLTRDDLPDYYEQYEVKHFEILPLDELRWLAGEWGVEVKGRTKASFIQPLYRRATERLKDW